MGIKRRFISLTPRLFIQQVIQVNSNEETKGPPYRPLSEPMVGYRKLTEGPFVGGLTIFRLLCHIYMYILYIVHIATTIRATVL